MRTPLPAEHPPLRRKRRSFALPADITADEAGSGRRRARLLSLHSAGERGWIENCASAVDEPHHSRSYPTPDNVVNGNSRMKRRVLETGISVNNGVTLLALISGLALLSSGSEASAQVTRCAARTFNVYFEQWQSTLNSEAKAALTAAQRSFRGCRIEHARVIGLAGAPGNTRDNQALSENRTRVVADSLVDGGWPRSSLELVALGDRGAKLGDEDRPIRRRVQVEVHSQPTR